MTPTEALTAIRDLANAALGGVVVAPPVDPPGAVLGPADADGSVRLSRVESYFAQNPDPVVIQQFPGEPPIAPIVAVRRFHLLDGLSLIADAERAVDGPATAKPKKPRAKTAATKKTPAKKAKAKKPVKAKAKTTKKAKAKKAKAKK